MPELYTVGPHVQIEYERLWTHLLQETTSHLLPTVKKVTVNGERRRMSQLGAVAYREITGRALPTIANAPTTYVRWLVPKKYENPQIIPEWDAEDLGLLATPQSAYLEADVYAYNRQVDATIVAALNGNAITGEDGTTLTALPAAQIIDEDFGATNAGLTFAKVAEAKYRLDAAFVPQMNRHFICSPQEEQDLILNVIQVQSSDYTKVQPITDGSLMGKTWMGFTWHTQVRDLPVSEVAGNNYIRRAFAYHSDYVEFGDGQRRVNIDVLPERSQAIQIYARARMGASRRQEEGVVAIECYR
jgi:hypothetical protein